MTWWSAIFATVVVSLPLMYRTARGAFESFDTTLTDAGRTLGRPGGSWGVPIQPLYGLPLLRRKNWTA